MASLKRSGYVFLFTPVEGRKVCFKSMSMLSIVMGVSYNTLWRKMKRCRSLGIEFRMSSDFGFVEEVELCVKINKPGAGKRTKTGFLKKAGKV